MKKWRLKICLLAALIVLCFSALCSCFDIDDMIVDLGFYNEHKKVNTEYNVILRECAGVSLDDGEEAIQKVKSGSSVKFKITISDNYIYLGNTAGATYDKEKRIIELKDVVAPTTIDIILISKSELYTVDVYKNYEKATVVFTKGSAYSAEPGEITLKAIAPVGYIFSGWSSGTFLANGGTILERGDEYSFKQNDSERSVKVYANFTSEKGYELTYDPNGGLLNNQPHSYTFEKEYSEMFALQQTVHGNDDSMRFKRDGYQAIGFSTEKTTEYADYTSVNAIKGFSNMGGVCEVPRAVGELTLYVVWAKNTDKPAFTYETATYSDIWYAEDRNNNNSISLDEVSKQSMTGIVITKYNSVYNSGKKDTVVIPDYIDGKPVIGIRADAFRNVTGVKKVVIPQTVMKIESGAFSGCSSIKEVVFFDSLQYVYNASFSGNVSTVVLNSQKLPTYAGTAEGSFCIKYERVRANRDKKKIVVVSGSSSLNGLNSKMLSENFDNEYVVVNYGTNAATQSMFYIDVISNYVTDGDIIVHAPEWTSGASMGDNTIHWKLFRGNNQCYDIFREVDMSEYTNFWGAYMTCMIGKLVAPSVDGDYAGLQIGKAYQHPNTGMNYCGDLLGNRNSRTYSGNGRMMFSNGTLSAQRAANLNKVNARIKDGGGTVVFSFGTADALDVARADSAWKSKCDDFTRHCATLLDAPVISNVGTYVLGENDRNVGSKYQEMFNSAWHATYYGANIRTVELIYDLEKYLENRTDTWESYQVRESHRNKTAYKVYNTSDWY